MKSESLQRKVKSGSLIRGALLPVLLAVLCPCAASAGIPTEWSDVTTVNLAMGESKSFNNVTYRNCVYGLPKLNLSAPQGKHFGGWWCPETQRRYDEGMLIFNLLKSGERGSMSAIWE